MPDSIATAPAPSAPAPAATPAPAPAAPSQPSAPTTPAPSTARNPVERLRELRNEMAVQRAAEAKPEEPKVEEPKAEGAPQEVKPDPNIPQEAKPETPPEQKAEEPEPEAPSEEPIKIGPRGRASAKDLIAHVAAGQIPENVRGHITARLQREQDYNSTFSLEEARERKVVHANINEAKQDRQFAARAIDLHNAFTAPDPQATEWFVAELQRADPNAYQRLVQHIVGSVEQVDPDRVLSYGQKYMEAAIAKARRFAKEGRDFRGWPAENLGLLADGLETLLGWDEFAGQEQESDNGNGYDPNNPLVQELEFYRQREVEREQQQAQQFANSVGLTFLNNLKKSATEVLAGRDDDLSSEAQAELAGRLARRISSVMAQDQTETARLQEMVARSQRSPQARQAIVNTMMNKARAIMDMVLTEELVAFNKIRLPRQKQQATSAPARETPQPGAARSAPTTPHQPARSASERLRQLREDARVARG